MKTQTNKTGWGKNSHCTYCGHPFQTGQQWPRQCTHCQQVSYLNPLPVAVLLLPVDKGVLTVRREVGPGKGQLALPGGFIDLGESWQQACVRELEEEAGIQIEANQVTLFTVHSAPDGTVLIFGLAFKQQSQLLPKFSPTNETSERVILHQPTPLAFPLHTQVLETYFAQC